MKSREWKPDTRKLINFPLLSPFLNKGKCCPFHLFFFLNSILKENVQSALFKSEYHNNLFKYFQNMFHTNIAEKHLGMEKVGHGRR